MGFWSTVGDLIDAWTESISGPLLSGVLAVLLVLVLISVGVVFVQATRAERGTFTWTTATVLPAVGISALGLFTPEAFHWWLMASLLSVTLVAILNKGLLGRALVVCDAGHPLAATWVYCARCPAPVAPSALNSPSGRGAAAAGVTGLVLGGSPGMPRPGAGWGGGIAPRPVAGVHSAAPERPKPAGKMLLWLVPGSQPSIGERAIHAPGASLGRNPASDVVLDDQSVSWDHARIIERDGSPAVVDVGSSNGTFVNDEPVGTSLLISGDVLRLGDTAFKVVRA